jgi:uncharacterized membrane protein
MDNSSPISTSEIKNFLVRRLGEKEADELMKYIESEINKNISAKGDETRQEIDRWRNEIKNNFASKADAATLEKKLIKRVSKVEGTIILWSFVFWVTLILAMYIILKFTR